MVVYMFNYSDMLIHVYVNNAYRGAYRTKEEADAALMPF